MKICKKVLAVVLILCTALSAAAFSASAEDGMQQYASIQITSAKAGTEFHCAELVDLVRVAGRLICKLVGGEIEDLKPFISELLIHGLQRVIMRSIAASRRCVDDQQNLSLVFGETDFVSLPVFDCEIIYRFHFDPAFFPVTWYTGCCSGIKGHTFYRAHL